MDNEKENNLETATFAGGCFWCMEPPFKKLKGVAEVYSGYIGDEDGEGLKPDPTYEEVCSGRSGYIEAVEIHFDPSKVDYETLLDTFWRQIDPTDHIGQFADKGSQYITAIFYNNDKQKDHAERSKERLEKSRKFSKPIATKIIKALKFYMAEDYHQDYASNNSTRYNMYRMGSGRQSFIEKNWDE